MVISSPPPVDTLFRAFADRTRLRVLHLLSDRDELCVCDIIAALELPQAKVSRHLAYLRRAGLVDTRREGQWVHYRLRQPGSPLHTRLLDCLRCCLQEVPELKADRQRLTRCCT